MTIQRHFLHSINLPVRWGDMDAYGHVNNATYFRYFEEARIDWFKHRGIVVDGTGTGPVLIHATCTYLKPIVYPANLIINIYGGAPGRSSLPIYHEILLDNNPEIIYTQAETKIVWIDHMTEKSTPLPNEIRQLLPKA